MLNGQVTDPTHYADLVRTPAQRTAWRVVEPLLAELLEADVILIGVPMYNYSIPAALKAWIDQVTFPRMSLAGRSVVVASARGGSYAPGAPKAPYDHQESYLRDFFAGHMNLKDVTFLHAELTNTLVDPAIADLAGNHRASVAEAITSVDPVAAEIADRRSLNR